MEEQTTPPNSQVPNEVISPHSEPAAVQTAPPASEPSQPETALPAHEPENTLAPTEQSEANLPALLSWEASEYVAHQHGALWYLSVLGITVGLVAFLVLVLGEWLSAAVVVLMVIALVIYAHRAPRTLKYSLNQAGILVGAKFYPYGVFRSFALVQGQAFLTIELDPLKRFMPRLSMFIDQDDLDGVVETLEEHLPRAERKADVVDRLSHKLKF